MNRKATTSNDAPVSKVRTEIEGFDLITYGGLPRGRCTLVAGTAGSAKTVVAAQFLAAGIARAGESGVFVTFEEFPADIRRNLRGFGWDVPGWEAEGKWAFVDAAPQHRHPVGSVQPPDRRRDGARRRALQGRGR